MHRRLAPRRVQARARRLLLVLAASSATVLSAISPTAGHAAGEHVHDTQPAAPPAGDGRFMPGTVGPVVFRGTAATVSIPDGTGFGGEVGRRQNSADLRKNNYSVTDANFSHVLGLLPRHPDTGAPLTYVQHIQLYAAAGFLEAWAPQQYAHLVMHQDRGEGTVLGAAGYLMQLVRHPDPAAHGVDTATLPTALPGTSIAAVDYVRATRDATGQQWARPHHAQTAPMVHRMLLASGLTPSSALVLASDDGISGAGRVNGMNEQDGGLGGFNSGERSTWAFAAQLQAQTGVPVVEHMMHGHDHTGIDDSALTKPKVNALIGFPADERRPLPERAAALYEALRDGRVATAETAAADQKLVVREPAYLRPLSALDVDVDSPMDWHQDAGVERALDIEVENDGPHMVSDAGMQLTTSANLRIVSITPVAGGSCVAATCSIGHLSAETSRSRTFRVVVAFDGVGRAWLEARASSSRPTEAGQLLERREFGVHAPTTATVAVAARTVGMRAATCGARARTACRIRWSTGTSLVAGARPATYADKDRRWVKVVFQRRVAGRWKAQGDRWVQVNAAGYRRVRVKRDLLSARGAWRVRLEAREYHLLRAADSPWRYLAVR